MRRVTRAVRDATGCEDVIMTAGQIVDENMSVAAAWAAREGVPLNLGESGVHEPAALESPPQAEVPARRPCP